MGKASPWENDILGALQQSNSWGKLNRNRYLLKRSVEMLKVYILHFLNLSEKKAQSVRSDLP